MPANIDKVFGIHAQALELRARRAELLAANLANADTPNYRARDVDFNRLLRAALGNELEMQQPRTAHGGAPSGDPGAPELLYRVPLSPSADGNTVDVQGEQARFAENAVQYQVSLTFLNGKIRSLLTAIRGE